ncbi:MAG TPA: glycosyltransferase family 39 protein [Chloroflexia bacterium]|nr:glycosyltransferase family 39 protein [Chloroflexia bacterium]
MLTNHAPPRGPLQPWTPDSAPRRAGPPRRRANLGFWWGPIAWALALAGTLLLGLEPARLWGAGLLGGAGVLAVLTGRPVLPRPVWPAGVPARPPARLGRRHACCLAGIALAGLLAALADVAFLVQPGEPFGLAGLLWLLGSGGLVAAASAWPRVPPVPPAPALPWPGWERVVFAVLVGLALSLRVWDLAAVPFNIYPDEIMTGQIATQAYLQGPAPSIFSTLWSGIDLPALWFFGVALALKLSGPALAAVRLLPALFGAATVVPFYGLVRDAWGRPAALSGTAILACSAADLGYSRVALNNIVPQFFWATCFFFLLRGLRGRRPLDWALAGLAGGFSEYGYYGTRLLPFVLLAFAGYLLIVHFRQARAYLGHLGLLALGYGTAFGPLLAYYLLHPTLYFGRASQSLTWNHLPTSLADLQAMATTLGPLLGETLLGFSTHPSQDLVYFAPLLLPAEAALLPLGLALLIWHWRHPAAFLVLLAGTAVLLVGGVLVLYSPPPFLAHWTPGFPAFYACLAVPLGAWLDPGRDAEGGGRNSLSSWRGRQIVLLLGLVLLGLLNVDFYFHRYYADVRLLAPQLRAPQTSYELQAAQSRWQAALGPMYHVYTVGRTAQPYDPETTRYLVTGQTWAAVPDPPTGLPPPAPGAGLAFIFFLDTAQYRALVAGMYPDGTPGEVRNPLGTLLFYTYVRPPAADRGP